MAVTIAPGVASLVAPIRSRRELDRLGTAILELAGFPEADFDLHVVSDARMTRLMAAHKSVPAPTNTLAFPAEDGGDYLGGLYLSAHALEREAFLYGQHPDEHLVRLVAHGLLHLAGFDHGELMDELTEAAVEGLSEVEEELGGRGTS